MSGGGRPGESWRSLELRLGREEQIPLRLTWKLVGKLRQAAGAAWPVETIAV